MDNNEVRQFFADMAQNLSGDDALLKFWTASEAEPKDYPKYLINNIARQFYINYYENVSKIMAISINKLKNKDKYIFNNDLSLDPNIFGLDTISETLKHPILLPQTDYDLFYQCFIKHNYEKIISIPELIFAAVVRSKDDFDNSKITFNSINLNRSNKKTYLFTKYCLSSGVIASGALMFYFWKKYQH